MTKSKPISIRRALHEDVERLFEINGLSVPGVSSETYTDLRLILDLGETFVACDASDFPLGFVNFITPGTQAYQSANLRWFEAWQVQTGKSVQYVDRIAIDPAARGMGLGERLYQHAFVETGSFDGLGCEVNLLPPNPGSHRFHKRLGFKEVGRQVFVPNSKQVAYYVRPSTSSAD
ncbi:MAG: GNAT family N-acetyltransferase [Pseudomonadota bacterium]